MDSSSFFQSLSLPLASWIMWTGNLSMNTEAKKPLKYFSLLHIQVIRFPISFQRGPVFLISLIYLCPNLVQSVLKLSLPDTWLLKQFLCIIPRLPVLASTFHRLSFCLNLARSYLLIHAGLLLFLLYFVFAEMHHF